MKLFFSWMTILYYSRRHNLFFGYDMTITLSFRSYRTIGVISFHFILSVSVSVVLNESIIIGF